MMKYTLMQKNEPVAYLNINDKYGAVTEVIKVIDADRLPLSVKYMETDNTLENAVESWMHYRNVPKTRDGLGAYLKCTKGNLIYELSMKSLGLNLSDQYWFKPDASDIHWEDVNFFQNDFSGNPLEMSFASEIPSPDYSSNGNLSKYWTIQKGKRVLVKAGKGPFHQQPINEIIADMLLKQANIPHVVYDLAIIDQKPWSTCISFIDENTEYIPAYEILYVKKKEKTESTYHHFLQCMEALHIPTTKKEIDTMLQFDYLINNTDRHYGNFGFVRDVNTLEFKGLAPIFDNGNSLWYDEPLQFITPYKQKAYPFAQKQDKQLKLTEQTMDWLEKLDEPFIENTITSAMNNSPFLSEERTQKTANTVISLKKNLENYMTHGYTRETP